MINECTHVCGVHCDDDDDDDVFVYRLILMQLLKHTCTCLDDEKQMQFFNIMLHIIFPLLSLWFHLPIFSYHRHDWLCVDWATKSKTPQKIGSYEPKKKKERDLKWMEPVFTYPHEWLDDDYVHSQCSCYTFS